MELQNKIIDVAKSYIGQREITGNSGFVNKDFEKEMISVGWAKNLSWCAYFVKLVILKATEGTQKDFYMLLSPSAVATMTNFKNHKKEHIHKHPLPGDIAIFQNCKNGKMSWQGHTGIVLKVNKTTFDCIEGNSNHAGEREGIEVSIRSRRIDFSIKDGLVLLGFIRI